jgi:hypothetical protein
LFDNPNPIGFSKIGYRTSPLKKSRGFKRIKMGKVKIGAFFPVAVVIIFLWIFIIAWKLEPASAKTNSGGAAPAVQEHPDKNYRQILMEPRGGADLILEAYKNEVSRPKVTAFFSAIANSEPIARAILDNAAAFNISPSLAFALCWEESRYHVRAVNRKNENNSVDRGLFQLNCCSFPQLKESDFFNPAVNAYYAMAHLSLCLESGGSDLAGLAMYNAGTGRVRKDGTPKRTLDYISRILQLRENMETLFEQEYGQELFPAAETEQADEEKDRNFFQFILAGIR